MTQTSKDETRQVILIDLDVLLDTRLAALAATDVAWTKAVLEDGSYRNRVTDVWDNIRPGLDVDKYNDIYDNRDAGLLKTARLSGFMKNLLSIVKHYEYDLATRSDMVSDVIFVINTYPYNLSEDVKYHLVKAMKEYIGTVVEVKLTSIPMEKSSLRYLVSKGFTQYVLYDFSKWGGHHFETEDKVAGKHDFAIVAPALLNESFNDEVKQQLAENNVSDEDPFELTKIVFAAIMDLSFLPAFDFSLLDIENLPERKTPPPDAD